MVWIYQDVAIKAQFCLSSSQQVRCMKKKNIQFQIDVYLLFKVELGYFPIIVFIPLVKLLYGTPENHHAMSKTDAKKHRKLLTSMETRESRKVVYQSSFIRKYRCWDLVEIERFFFGPFSSLFCGFASFCPWYTCVLCYTSFCFVYIQLLLPIEKKI